MIGQYIGSVNGIVPGSIVVDIDRYDDEITGSALMIPSDVNLPATCVKFPLIPLAQKMSFSCSIVPVLRNGTEISAEELEQEFPNVMHGEAVEVNLELADKSLKFDFSTDIGTSGYGLISDSAGGERSELRTVEAVKTWADFKSYVNTIDDSGIMFRGQSKPYRLRTTFHRSNRKDLVRYVDRDLVALKEKFESQRGFKFDNPEQFGALLNWLQHHGYPTPLLDWTESAWVAAFFAHRNPHFDSSGKVRIFVFDYGSWCNDFPQYSFVSRVPLHFSFLRLRADQNRRVERQKALTILTNIDDIESYIAFLEGKTGREYLWAIDLPASERAHVLHDLQKMNISPELLFPGSDDHFCESLRNDNFYNRLQL